MIASLGRRSTFAFAMALAWCLATDMLAQGPPNRTPTPSEEQQRQAFALVAEVYKAEYNQAVTAEQRLALARRMLADAAATQEDAAGKFVLHRVARDIAAQQGDLALSFQAIDHLAAIFEIDALSMRAQAAAAATKVIRTREASAAALPTVVAVTDQAVADDRYPIAVSTAALAVELAKKTGDAEQERLQETRVNEVGQLAAEFTRVTAAVATLQMDPTDPAANRTVGWYRCIAKRDWARGIPMLALGDDARLRGVAVQELAEGADGLALGDQWWAIADGLEGAGKTPLGAHALDCYRRALPSLTGLPRAKVLKRIGDFYGPVPQSRQNIGFALKEFDCGAGVHEMQMDSKFEYTRSWALSLEARIPSLDSPNFQIMVFWGDDRVGMDPLSVGIEGPRLIGAVDDCSANVRHGVTIELPRDLVMQWTKVTFVYRAPEQTVQLYINDKLAGDAKIPHKLNFDRPMPVRIGGSSGVAHRFHGQVRSIVLGNLP